MIGAFKEQLEIGIALTVLGGLGTAVGIFQGLVQLFTKPSFKIKGQVNQVRDIETPYGYFDLIIRNVGWHIANNCELKLTIEGEGLRNEDIPLLWRKPTPHGQTEESPTANIKGRDKFKTTIFEIWSNQDYARIFTQQRNSIDIKEGQVYTFVFSVNGEPPAPKTAKFKVYLNSWENITVKQINWYSPKALRSS